MNDVLFRLIADLSEPFTLPAAFGFIVRSKPALRDRFCTKVANN
jgi:hypothetical protein